MEKKKNDAAYETQHVVQHFDLSVSVVLVRSPSLLLACSMRSAETATSQKHNTKVYYLIYKIHVVFFRHDVSTFS